MGKVQRAAPGIAWASVTLILTDDDGIREAHARTMGIDSVTDVITLCYDPVPGEPVGHAGELIVNVERALACGPSHWHRVNSDAAAACRELALYIAHGCDHLGGATDDTTEARRRMRRRELRWLRDAATHLRLEHLLMPRRLYGEG